MSGINNSTRPIILIGTDDRHDLIEEMQKKLSLVLLNEVQAEYNPQKYFTDGAPNMKLKESVRGKHVYVITDPNSNDANAA
jgi:phosphoribosylpyrophosphate synthetase